MFIFPALAVATIEWVSEIKYELVRFYRLMSDLALQRIVNRQ